VPNDDEAMGVDRIDVSCQRRQTTLNEHGPMTSNKKKGRRLDRCDANAGLSLEARGEEQESVAGTTRRICRWDDT